MKLFKQVPADRCTRYRTSLGCGAPESAHPLNQSGDYHEFEGGAFKWAEATPEDIREALDTLPSTW